MGVGPHYSSILHHPVSVSNVLVLYVFWQISSVRQVGEDLLASLLLSQEVHPKLVQEHLGHADITTTLNTYSHVIPSLRDKTASDMEGVLGAEDAPLRGEPPP